MVSSNGILSDVPARVTSYDVARSAGVSQSAVSRCFRDGSSVSAEKRGRIEAAARALGYAPSKIARSLITNRSNMLGVLISEATAHSYGDLLFRLGAEIQAAGYRMLVFTVSGTNAAAASLPDIIAYNLDGLICGVSVPDAVVAACAERHIPIVLYNRSGRGGWACSVGCDDPGGLSALAAHLRRGGSRRLKYIAGPAEAPVSQSRGRALRDAAAEHGLEVLDIVHADWSYDGGRAAMLRLLDEGPRPDTVVCANDSMALGAIDACRFDLKLDVPGDIAVAGYDNVPEGAWPTYALTTLAQPLHALTRTAVRMIREQLDGSGTPGEQRRMPATLVVRGSTRPASGPAA